MHLLEGLALLAERLLGKETEEGVLHLLQGLVHAVPFLQLPHISLVEYLVVLLKLDVLLLNLGQRIFKFVLVLFKLSLRFFDLELGL